MDAFDLDIRRHVYFSIVANGRPPTVRESARAFDFPEGAVAETYERLHDAHALVLFPGTHDVWMANPFCFGPTPHRVTAGGRTWTGTCCWDSLGIPAALHTNGSIVSECACCGEKLELVIEGAEVTRGSDVLCHVLVPARSWWEDIGFT